MQDVVIGYAEGNRKTWFYAGSDVMFDQICIPIVNATLNSAVKFLCSLLVCIVLFKCNLVAV